MKKHDIVYIIKNGYDREELIYSIRSVCAHFPYRRIWTYGGRPSGILPDRIAEITQTGETKWEKVSNTLREICCNEDISRDFWLFNDDFFIMKPAGDPEPMYAGTLDQRVARIRNMRGGMDSAYGLQLQETARILRSRGYETLDYALHIPMLINREKALQTLDEFEGCPMFRSLYGNHHGIGGRLCSDVKILEPDRRPDPEAAYLSTNDKTWNGKAGRYIRSIFSEPCRYEEKTPGV